jgi:peptidoglycan/LPS O-acetylase OafA/YrhL
LTPSHIHLPGLNGIRAIAAVAVLLSHIDQFSRLFGLPTLGFSQHGAAVYGVILFFVLSGYLITYLLLVERNTCGRVHIRDFYIRRMLRIWPLYYLVFFGTVLFMALTGLNAPGGLRNTTLLYGLFLSNVGYALGYGVLTILPLWSVGVEEQFYAFWPILINRTRSVARALFGVLFGYLAVNLCLRLTANGVMLDVVGVTPYSCLAIGGLMAVATFENSPVLKIVFAPAAQVLAWLVLGIGVVLGPPHLLSTLDREINALFHAIVIANVSRNPKTLISLEHRLCDYLGKISYGIYVLHVPCLVLTAYLVHDRYGIVLNPTPAGYAVAYAIVTGGTLLLATASYRWFEQPFLRWKSAFSRIETAPVTGRTTGALAGWRAT